MLSCWNICIVAQNGRVFLHWSQSYCFGNHMSIFKFNVQLALPSLSSSDKIKRENQELGFNIPLVKTNSVWGWGRGVRTVIHSFEKIWVQKVKKNWLQQVGFKCSPPPVSVPTTQPTFIKIPYKGPFVGPHHLPKFLGQKAKSNH